MLNRILPRNVDNSYQGHRLAIWLLILILMLKTATALTSIFIGQLTMQGAHKVALSSFPPEAVQLLALFLARSALSSLVLVLFCVLVLVRYRAMIPLTYVLLLVDHAGRALLILRESAITGPSSATVVGSVLLVLTIVGLAFSLYEGSDSNRAPTAFSGPSGT